MLGYHIRSIDDATNLARLCGQFAETGLEIDINYGRYIIDGYSILGIFSLMGHTVSIELRSDDETIKKEFEEKLRKITPSE